MNAHEWTVLRAIPADQAPYVDTIRLRAGLPRPAFDAAVRKLVRACVLMKCSAPHGELLYPTLRGAAHMPKATTCQ